MPVSINGSTGITGAIDIQSTGSVLSGVTTVSAGSTSAPSITPTGDSNTGVFFPSADTIAFAEGGVEAARFDSSGRLLVGTSSSRTLDSVQHQLQVEGGFTPYGGVRISSFFDNIWGPSVSLTHSRSSTVGSNTIVQSGDRVGNVSFYGADGTNYVPAAGIRAEVDGTPGTNDMPGRLVFSTTADGASSPTERVRIDSQGRMGVGTNSPGRILDVRASNTEVRTTCASTDYTAFLAAVDSGASCRIGAYIGSWGFLGTTSNHPLVIETNSIERVRIDSQGRMGVGTNSPNSLIHILDSVGSSRISIESSGSGGVLATFTAERNGGLRIASESAAGWLAFNTGQSGTTERMRLDSGGALRHTGSGSISVTTGYSTVGCAMEPNGTLLVTRSSAGPGFFNRLTDDGTLVVFAQDTVTEGTISVSGTTVSYNGAHLSRWSQLINIDPHDKTQRPEILRGTVMSNLDEMCEWIDPETGEAQDNEQLNKTEISSVEDDPNVAGVFQSWDDDDDTWVNDYYLAMTGDFVIRIAEGVEVNRGDLLISAGDGTAKPQGDRYLKDSTIAKVTSTNVTCTYDDGSYCVPCVLMAC